jgi:hypothetical protein
MARPSKKLNPIKKTYYLEARSVQFLEEMARQDKRSMSQYLELLIEADWAKSHKKK